MFPAIDCDITSGYVSMVRKWKACLVSVPFFFKIVEPAV